MIERGRNMAQINTDRIAGMNIHYLYYSLPYFLDTQQKLGVKTIDEWFDTFGDEIIHMHFIDGNPYGHLIWGDGNHPLGEWIDTVVRRGYKVYFGQEITDFAYFEDPASHDKRNMEAYKPYLLG